MQLWVRGCKNPVYDVVVTPPPSLVSIVNRLNYNLIVITAPPKLIIVDNAPSSGFTALHPPISNIPNLSQSTPPAHHVLAIKSFHNIPPHPLRSSRSQPEDPDIFFSPPGCRLRRRPVIRSHYIVHRTSTREFRIDELNSEAMGERDGLPGCWRKCL